MARRIVEAGFPLTLWARRPQSLEPFEDTAATVASTPAAVAEASSIVCICVTGDEDVFEVVTGAEGVLSGLAAGGTLIVHSTVHPETCVRLHLMGEEKGITVLDAPVSGGGTSGRSGNIARDGRWRRGRPRPCPSGAGDVRRPDTPPGRHRSGADGKAREQPGIHRPDRPRRSRRSAFADELGLDRVAMAQVFERGSGASRAASLLSAPGFDIGGLGRVAGPLLRKDVGLIADVARRRQIAAPESVVTLAQEGLRRLHAAAQESVSPRTV